VERVDHGGVRPAVGIVVAGDGVRRVPHVLARRAPREVAHVLRAEAPGQLAVLAARGGAPRAAVLRRHDVDDVWRAARAVEPLAHGGGEYLLRVLERAGRRDEPALGHGDRDVVVAVAHVELGVGEVGIGLPSGDAVVDGELRVPVAEVEDLAVLAHARRAERRDGERPGELEVHAAAGRDGLGQRDVEDGAVDLVAGRLARLPHLERAAVGGDALELDALGDGDHAVAHRVRPVRVLVEVHGDAGQRVGRAVVVADGAAAAEAGGCGVELRLDAVVRVLLPVVRPGPPGAGGRAVFGRAPERRRLEDGVGARPCRHLRERRVRGYGHGRGPRRWFGCRAAGRAGGEHGYGEREEAESGRHGWLLCGGKVVERCSPPATTRPAKGSRGGARSRFWSWAEFGVDRSRARWKGPAPRRELGCEASLGCEGRPSPGADAGPIGRSVHHGTTRIASEPAKATPFFVAPRSTSSVLALVRSPFVTSAGVEKWRTRSRRPSPFTSSPAAMYVPLRRRASGVSSSEPSPRVSVGRFTSATGSKPGSPRTATGRRPCDFRLMLPCRTSTRTAISC